MWRRSRSFEGLEFVRDQSHRSGGMTCEAVAEIPKDDTTDSKIAVFIHEDVAGFLGKEVLKDGELRN